MLRKTEGDHFKTRGIFFEALAAASYAWVDLMVWDPLHRMCCLLANELHKHKCPSGPRVVLPRHVLDMDTTLERATAGRASEAKALPRRPRLGARRHKVCGAKRRRKG